MTKPRPSTILCADDSGLLHLRRSFIRHLGATVGRPRPGGATPPPSSSSRRSWWSAGYPTTVTELMPDHLEAFIVSLYELGMRPTTILARHYALSRFFRWLVAENELAASPMASIRAPAARLPEPQVLTGEEIAALLAACDGDHRPRMRHSPRACIGSSSGSMRRCSMPCGMPGSSGSGPRTSRSSTSWALVVGWASSPGGSRSARPRCPSSPISSRRSGLVRRTRDRHDGRAVIVEPTNAVKRGSIVARDAVDAVESRWRTQLGERRFRAMADAIGQLAALDDD